MKNNEKKKIHANEEDIVNSDEENDEVHHSRKISSFQTLIVKRGANYTEFPGQRLYEQSKKLKILTNFATE